MQFHLNGFRTGDPDVKTPAEDVEMRHNSANLPQFADVVIVGCGPAGLTLAAQLCAYEGISTCIVDQKEGPLELGQADGIACRTMEMFQAFGFAEKVLREAYWVNETSFWKPDPKNPQQIARSARIQDTEDGLSEFPHVILNQARVHDFYLDLMAKSTRKLHPHYGRRLVDLQVAAAGGDYPVTLTFEVGEGEALRRETISARYVVGCDGARSQVRKSIGRTLHGDAANQAWGVMDVLADTDFPDIRRKAAVHSTSEGNVLIIPREGGYLVRLYVELDKLAENERVAERGITSDRLVAAAKRILQPYRFEVREIAWWSVYEIGQRLCDHFDNAGDENDKIPNVFIAGDACHTHSPKAGQGMNVSMQDTFNLGWKLGAVLTGLARPDLLRSYSEERREIARELIEFDRAFARMFSAKPVEAGAEGAAATVTGDEVDPREFQKYFVKQGRFTAGTATRYPASRLTMGDDHQALAKGFLLGSRFHSAPVVRYADAKPMHLGHAAEADGRWRLYAFAPRSDPADATGAIGQLCDYLENDETSPLTRYLRKGQDVDAVIDLRVIFQEGFLELPADSLPGLLKPKKGRYGLTDHEKVFCADQRPGQDIFDLRTIDREEGALVLVRPDQYIADVLPLTGRARLSAYFERVFIPLGCEARQQVA